MIAEKSPADDIARIKYPAILFLSSHSRTVASLDLIVDQILFGTENGMDENTALSCLLSSHYRESVFSKSIHASVDFSCESKSPNIVIRVLYVGNDKWDRFEWSKSSPYKHDIQIFIDRSSGPQIDSKPDVTIKSETVRKVLLTNKSIEIKTVNDRDRSIMEFSGTRKRDNEPFIISGFIYLFRI